MGDLLTGVLGLLIAVAMPFVVLEGHAAVQSLRARRRLRRDIDAWERLAETDRKRFV